jgi:hypothetical protein
MRKGLLVATALLFSLAGVGHSKEVEVGMGWNLLGTACDLNVESLNKTEIKTVWTWDRELAYWKVWSPNEAIMEIIESYGLSPLGIIPAYSGFWVSADGDTTISLCDGVKESNNETENGTIDLNRGLVAYWSFDNCDARDDSGNGNDGGTGNFTCSDGMMGKALEFYGQNYIVGKIKTLPMGDSERTVCLWARSGDGAEFAEPNFAFSYGESIDKTAYGIFEDGPPWIESGNWFTYTHCGEEPCDVDSGISVNSEWQFICSIYSNGIIKNYVDGIKGKEEKIEINTTGNYFYIGTSPMESYNFVGLIDEIRIYNRALTEDEIKALYEQGK